MFEELEGQTTDKRLTLIFGWVLLLIERPYSIVKYFKTLGINHQPSAIRKAPFFPTKTKWQTIFNYSLLPSSRIRQLVIL